MAKCLCDLRRRLLPSSRDSRESSPIESLSRSPQRSSRALWLEQSFLIITVNCASTLSGGQNPLRGWPIFWNVVLLLRGIPPLPP